MKTYANYDHSYAATRLRETVVRTVDGLFVEVLNIVSSIHQIGSYNNSDIKPKNLKQFRESVEDNTPVVVAIDSRDDRTILIKMEDLDINPLPLGYVNYNKTASYVVRTPIRKDWRQGTRHNNLRAYGEDKREVHKIPYKVLINTSMGRMPSLKSCIDKCKRGVVKSIAWHPDWCLDQTLGLHCKGRKVGVLDEGDNFILSDQFKYLQEALDEACQRNLPDSGNSTGQ